MKNRTVNTHQNQLDPVQYLVKLKAQVLISDQMNAGIWYDPLTTESELNITKNNKTETLQAATSMELAVSQEQEKYKHMEIDLLMELNPYYESLRVYLTNKFTVGAKCRVRVMYDSSHT